MYRIMYYHEDGTHTQLFPSTPRYASLYQALGIAEIRINRPVSARYPHVVYVLVYLNDKVVYDSRNHNS